MMSLKIIDTDMFMDMPASTQNLYFHLLLRADDDGFIGNQKKIMRMVSANDDDMKILANKGFVIPVVIPNVIPNGQGIIVIAHWKVHNLIRSDRYTETIYKEEKDMLEIANSTYQLSYQMEPQVRLGKVRVVKGNKQPVRSRSSGGDYSEDFETWWNTYPKKVGKGGAYVEWKKLKAHMPPLQDHLDKVIEWSKSEKWTNENGQYIPNPKTWIKERRWDDELPSKQINKYEGLKTYGRCAKCGKENDLINNVCIDCIKEQNNVA